MKEEDEEVKYVHDKIKELYPTIDELEEIAIFSLSLGALDTILVGEHNPDWATCIIKRIATWVLKYSKIEGDRINFNETELALFMGFKPHKIIPGYQ